MEGEAVVEVAVAEDDDEDDEEEDGKFKVEECPFSIGLFSSGLEGEDPVAEVMALGTTTKLPEPPLVL